MKYLISLLLVTFSITSFSQTFLERVEPGASICYDFQTNGVGVGVRAVINLSDRFAFTPQFDFYPGFEEIQEFYAGAALHVNITPYMGWVAYALAAGSYNNWMNYEDFTTNEKNKSSLAIEPGIGVVKNDVCVKPFAEARYNLKWKEATFRIGILFNFPICERNRAQLCPAFH